MSCLSRDRRFATRSRSVFKIARSLRILRPFRRDNDMVQTKGDQHLARNLILLLISGFGPITVRPQTFVQVAAVKVDQVIALLNNLFGNQVRSALSLSA